MYEIIHTKRLFLKLFISTDDRRIIDSKVIFSIKKIAKVQKKYLKMFWKPIPLVENRFPKAVTWSWRRIEPPNRFPKAVEPPKPQ
jgi:hypothetical protein